MKRQGKQNSQIYQNMQNVEWKNFFFFFSTQHSIGCWHFVSVSNLASLCRVTFSEGQKLNVCQINGLQN